MTAKSGHVVLVLLFMFFCGCANDNYVSVAKKTIEKNSLTISQTSLAKRIAASPECNTSAKTVDALASYGYFSTPIDEEVIIPKELNATALDSNSSAKAISRLYERGYKLEAKRAGMALLSSPQTSFALLETMAKIYESEGDLRGATLFYIDALNFDPKNEKANLALARLYYQQNKPKQAIRYAKIALANDGLESKHIKDLIEKIEKMLNETDKESK